MTVSFTSVGHAILIFEKALSFCSLSILSFHFYPLCVSSLFILCFIFWDAPLIVCPHLHNRHVNNAFLFQFSHLWVGRDDVENERGRRRSKEGFVDLLMYLWQSICPVIILVIHPVVIFTIFKQTKKLTGKNPEPQMLKSQTCKPLSGHDDLDTAGRRPWILWSMIDTKQSL